MSSTEKKSSFFDKLKSVFLGPEEQSDREKDTMVTKEDKGDAAPLKTQAPQSYTPPKAKRDESLKPMAVKKVIGYEDPFKEPIQEVVNTPVSHEEIVEEGDLDITFAEHFTAAGGKFLFCESRQEMVEILQQLKENHHWSNIYYWEDEVKEIVEGYDNLKISIGCTLETSQAAISMCEYIVASDGSIILSSKQASTRGLSVFPNAHIIIADASRLARNLNEGIKKFNKIHGSELPFAIYLSDKFAADSKPATTLVLNAHGTQNIFLLFVDEKIYK
jgi:L-lactate dehydrogenase complex protein LldG